MTKAFSPLVTEELEGIPEYLDTKADARPTVVSPVPLHAEPLENWLVRQRRLKPDNVWGYRNAPGDALFAVVRWNRLDGTKQIYPYSWCRTSDGKEDWNSQHHPEPRPLYGLDRLAAAPLASLVIVEGEKCADAAGSVFPDAVPITSPCGSDAANSADWNPVRARHSALIWPDNDDGGHRYALDVATILDRQGIRDISLSMCASLRLLPTMAITATRFQNGILLQL